MRLAYILISTLVLFSSGVSANKLAEGKHFRDLEKESVKCSVVLVGGKTTVLRYYNIPVRDKRKLKSDIKARGVNAGKKHYSIHKINECVNINKKFKGAISQKVDITTANNG